MNRNGSRRRRTNATSQRPASSPNGFTRTPPSANGSAAPDFSEPRSVDRLVTEAIAAAITNDPRSLSRLVDLLVYATPPAQQVPGGPQSSTGPHGSTGSVAVEHRMGVALRTLWANGWQPLDVVHVVNRSLSSAHAALAVRAIAAERLSNPLPVDPRWAAQLEQLGAVSAGAPTHRSVFGTAPGAAARVIEVEQAIEVIAAMLRFSRLESHLPPPGAPSSAFAARRTRSTDTDPDDRVLSLVRALLAKAESTTFEGEAEAFTAKAQELIARHAIDHAMLHHGVRGDAPTARRVHLEDPYADAKSSLLAVVARANRCETVYTPDYAFSTLLGFEEDLDLVDLLFTSLLAQSTNAMLAAGRRPGPSTDTRSRSFRQTFLLAFAARIGERLDAANAEAEEAAREELGDSFLPVLASRAAQVEDFVAEVFPNTVTRRRTITNASGWHAGRQAADAATIAIGGRLPGASPSPP